MSFPSVPSVPSCSECSELFGFLEIVHALFILSMILFKLAFCDGFNTGNVGLTLV